MGERKEITRRSFLNLVGTSSAGIAGMSVLGLPGFNQLFAQAVKDLPVLWLPAGSCTGCSVSLLNSLSPTIQDLLLGEVLPGAHVSLQFHATVMAGQGQQVIDVLDKYKEAEPGSFVLVMEGALSTKDDGVYCEVGEHNGHGIPLKQHFDALAPKAMAVINMGTCSSFGGIPAAPPNPTGIQPVGEYMKAAGMSTPYVNVPGCPPHPDWFVGTVATVLLGGLDMLKVDEHGRPLAFYGKLMHDNCEFRGNFDKGQFAQNFGDKACLYKLGCKGPVTHADCPRRRWNSGVNWCIGSGSPCIGCVEPSFPYKMDMYEVVHIHEQTAPDAYPLVDGQKGGGVDPLTTGIVGGFAGAAIGVGIASSRAKKKAEAADAEPKEG